MREDAVGIGFPLTLSGLHLFVQVAAMFLSLSYVFWVRGPLCAVRCCTYTFALGRRTARACVLLLLLPVYPSRDRDASFVARSYFFLGTWLTHTSRDRITSPVRIITFVLL